MNIEQTLYNAAVDFIKNRYPAGWGGAAAIHTVDDRILISVAPEALNAGVELCIEKGTDTLWRLPGTPALLGRRCDGRCDHQ